MLGLIEWDRVEVLDPDDDLCGRKVKEGIHCQTRINRDEGMDLSPECFTFTKKLLHRRLERSCTVQQDKLSLLLTIDNRMVVPGDEHAGGQNQRTILMHQFCTQ